MIWHGSILLLKSKPQEQAARLKRIRLLEWLYE